MLPAPLARALLAALALAALAAAPAAGFPGTLEDWRQRYGAVSPSGDDAGCTLCHGDASGGSPWNGYGWDIRLALEDVAGCDRNGDGTVSNAEAFYCVESQNSDRDGSGRTNLDEIGVGAQPGWTAGATNILYSRAGTETGLAPPMELATLDPDGTEPPPMAEPPPPDDDEPLGPPKRMQIVTPGDSLQRAVDRAKHGGMIFVMPGTYRETADPTNGLNIHKSVHLIGLSSFGRRVVLENAGNQRNGIVAVPEDRQDCMSCHSSMEPPFELHPGVEEPGMKMREPMIRGLTVSGVTIKDFGNNGLFTENVDGFSFWNVESIDNPNYGIFPTLSKNGVIAKSKATGARDSGIWVETSEKVRVTRNVVTDNTNGFEVSNSDDITLDYNIAFGNTVGFAMLLLPEIFDDRPGAKRVDVKRNVIVRNNRPNNATPGSVLATVPPGMGILHLGVDDSEISRNYVAENDFIGLAVVNYCLAVVGTPFACEADASVTEAFLEDQSATGNRTVRNAFVRNGLEPGSDNPFAFAASDLGLLSGTPGGNCFEENDHSESYSLTGSLPACEPED